MADHIASREDGEALFDPMRDLVRMQVQQFGTVALPAIVFGAIQVASENGLLQTFETTLVDALETARGAMQLQKDRLS